MPCNKTIRKIKLRVGAMRIYNRNWVVEISFRVNKNLQPQYLHILVFYLPGVNRIRKLGYKDISLRGDSQVLQPTKLVLSVVKTIQAKALQERNNALGVDSMDTSCETVLLLNTGNDVMIGGDQQENIFYYLQAHQIRMILLIQ